MGLFKAFTLEAAHRLPNAPQSTSVPGCMATLFGWTSTWEARSILRPGG